MTRAMLVSRIPTSYPTPLLHATQARDLHEWEDNPECFNHEADVGSWEDHLRSCAETLFAVLLEVCCPRPSITEACALHPLFRHPPISTTC